jgi:hypothetical protein
MKTLRVHAVANLCDTLGAGTNCVYKPACQVAAYGRVLVDEGTNYSPEQVVFAVRAVEVVHVTPVLTMDSPGYSSKKSVYLPLQRSQIPRVQYVRTKTAEQAEEPPIGGKVSARTFVQSHHGHVGSLDPPAEIAIIRHTQHHMTKAIGRRAVNKVDQSGFEASHGESVNQMDHQGRIVSDRRMCAHVVEFTSELGLRQEKESMIGWAGSSSSDYPTGLVFPVIII